VKENLEQWKLVGETSGITTTVVRSVQPHRQAMGDSMLELVKNPSK